MGIVFMNERKFLERNKNFVKKSVVQTNKQNGSFREIKNYRFKNERFKIGLQTILFLFR